MMFPSEPHLPQSAEDQPCTSCDGHGKQMLSGGPDACVACDETGSGLREWLNSEDQSDDT